MNSKTYGVGYVLAILVVKVFSSDYHHILTEEKVTYKGPLNFFYEKNSNFLLMGITLNNISPSVTSVRLKYIFDQYNKQQRWSQQVLDVNIENKTSEVKFMILKNLIFNHIVVDLELYSQEEICGKTNIAEGRNAITFSDYFPHTKLPRNTYQDKDTLKYYYNAQYCFAPNLCKIVVDLNNLCPEKTTTGFSCNIVASQYICTFTELQHKMYRYYQTYGTSPCIGPAPEVKTIRTKLVIQLELFDNNTSINIATTRKKIIWSNKLRLTAEAISEDYSIVTIQSYSETKDIEYSCQEHMNKTKYLHVGFINTTHNMITTRNKTSIKRKFKMAENGTILCCLYYVYTTPDLYKRTEVLINRFVKNKTLLIYQSQEPIPNNVTGSKEPMTIFQTDWLIYLVPAFLGFCVLMLALYIIKQKRCCKKSQPVEETVELDNYATQNQVLYANLDFVKDENQPDSQNEEPNYANIIGVLHPL